MAAPIQMSSEQLQELLRGFTTLIAATQTQTPPPPAVQPGSFTMCTARFNGSEDANVGTFIDSITVYKDCADVSDENAIKGLPMLLTDLAAEWWSGIKSSVTTFDDALQKLKTAFGTKRPAYRIFRELFATEQDASTRTDIFVCKARALISQLPAPGPPISMQLDMIYGLLHRRIRQRVRRDEVTTYDGLLELARTAEDALKEDHVSVSEVKSTDRKNTAAVEKRKDRPRCAFCRAFGHSEHECRKHAAQASPLRNSGNSGKPSSEWSDRARRETRCFGCGAPGVIRSQCVNCRKSAPTVDTPSTVSFSSFGADTAAAPIRPRARPVFNIAIRGVSGTGYVDTAAQHSVASRSLYDVLVAKQQQFTKVDMKITLADGVPQTQEVLTTRVDVTIKGRCVPTTFIVFPEATSNSTLLGADFLCDAGVVLNIAQQTWYFADQVRNVFALEREEISPQDTSGYVSSLRADEGRTLQVDQRRELTQLIEDNEAIFRQGGEPTPYAEHHITTDDCPPISMPPYKMTAQKKDILRAELTKMLRDGIIEECESPWGAPVVLVPKKDGNMRLCIDYRRLNSKTVSDSYPMPRIDELLHDTGHTKYMSTLDLKSGYYQVTVRAADRDKTAFVTPFGTYRFLRMPMGLKNSGATFQRLMDKFKNGLKRAKVLVYLDDLIVLSKGFGEHLQDLQDVFDRLRTFKLTANREKCTFAKTEIKYLGHVITEQGIATDPAKVRAIRDMKPPRNVKQVRTFMQTCSWYRRYVPNFSKIAKPLSDLTKKDAVWTWSGPEQRSYDELKTALMCAPILRQADPTMSCIIRTDASGYAIGAVLLQGEGPDERPVEYASRLLTSAERNYHTTEREALAVVHAVKVFRGYIEGSKVIVETDHQALRWLMTLRSPAGRLARWALLLQEYDLEIRYTPGRRNVVADTLSRPPCCDDGTTCNLCTFSVDLPTTGAGKLRQSQLGDPEVAKIVKCFEESDHPDLPNWRARGYVMMEGVLYRYVPEEDAEDAQLVVPEAGREEILRKHHDAPTAGHNGVEKTLRRIAGRYYWPGMRRYVEQYLKTCTECQRYKPGNTKPAGLLRTPVLAQRFEAIAIDLFGPLPATSTGQRWVFIVEDISTRWVELFALEDATAVACAKLLIEEVFLRYGIPRRVTSDNGVQFISSVMQQAMFCLGVEQTLTPLYHPEANPVERRNRDLKTQLAMLLQADHGAWSDRLPTIRYAMNTAVCRSTGHTPAYLTYGRELRSVDDVERDLRAIVASENFASEILPYLTKMADTMRGVRELHEGSQDRNKRYADAKRQPPPSYGVGDLVLVDTHVLSDARKGVSSKFVPRRDGPYQVVSKRGDVYEIAAVDRPLVPLGRYHTSALRKFSAAADHQPAPVRPLRRRGRPRKQGPQQSSEPESRPTTGRRGRPRKERSPGILHEGVTSDPEGETVARETS